MGRKGVLIILSGRRLSAPPSAAAREGRQASGRMRLVGPDTVKVYEASEAWPCFFCARPTLLRVQFGRRGTLPICGGCRGF